MSKENNEMLRNQAKEVKHHVEELSNIINSKTNVEPWVVAKMERASTDLSDITHYLDGEKADYNAPIYADGGIIDVIDKYNRMNLPSEIYANKKPYTGYATFINGYSGYGSTDDDGYLIGEGLYLTDENGSIIRSKERRGLTMYIEDGKFLEISSYADGGNLSAETQEKIAKLQKVVDSTMIPENVKEKARLEIEKLRSEGMSKGEDDKRVNEKGISAEQRELNKSVLALIDKAKIKEEQKLQGLVHATLEDANYHTAAFEFAKLIDSDIKTKQDWYDTNIFLITTPQRNIAIKIAQMCGWNGEKITDAYEFVLRMKGFHKLADALKKAMKGEDEYPNRIETLTKNQELYIKEIATRTATDQRAVTEFVKDNGLTETETLNLLQGLGMKKITSIDFVTALLGNKLYEQNIVAFAKSNEAFKSEPKKEETPKVADDRLKGKNISEVSTYIPHRAIEVIVTTFNGKKVTLNGADIFDGIYVDNKALGLEDNKTSRRKDSKTNDNKNVFKYQVKVNQYIPRGGNKGVDYYYVSDEKGNVINKNTGKIYRGKEMTNYKFSTNSEAQLYADKLNNKMADGGWVEKRPDFTKMSKEQLIDYSKKNNIPYALGWSKETLIEIIEDTLDSRYADGGKLFSVNPPIGQTKYSINTYDGKSTHKDGSEFIGMDSAKTKVAFNNLIKKYKADGYKEVSDVFRALQKSKMADGGELQSEIDNIDNRIYNLEQLKMVADTSDQDYYEIQIKNLEKEKADLMKKMESGDAPKKRGWFFKQGGQTAAQKKKIEKVMHEFKMGILKSSSGDKVTDREQAIAIALSEAGLSKKANGGGIDEFENTIFWVSKKTTPGKFQVMRGDSMTKNIFENYEDAASKARELNKKSMKSKGGWAHRK